MGLIVTMGLMVMCELSAYYSRQWNEPINEVVVQSAFAQPCDWGEKLQD